MGGDRRSRGLLESDIKRVCDAYVTGQYKVPGDKPLTPYRAGLALQEMDQLERAPSSGAVSAVFDRWVEIGFMEAGRKPYCFKDYTEAGRSDGLAALHRRDAAHRKAAREAARQAEQSAEVG